MVFLAVFNQSVHAENELLVDVTGVRNPCDIIQKAFDSYLNSNSQGMILRIKGSAEIQFNHFNDIGEYRLCAGLGPGLSSMQDPTYKPSKKKIKIRGAIIFDNLFLNYDAREQNKPAVIFQMGALYNTGWRSESNMMGMGDINIGGRMSGYISIRSIFRKVDNWIPGQLPSMPFYGNTMSRTTTVSWFETGILRTDMMDLSLDFEAIRFDDDDIGILHQHSWGVRHGPVRIENYGVGLLYYGNSVGSISSSYIHNNRYGLVLGDFNIGGDVIPSENCILGIVEPENKHDYCSRRNSQVFGLSVYDTVIEGNNYGNVIINDASRIDIRTTHLEMPLLQYQKGHGVLIGGGVCASSAAYAICASDEDCERGACKYPENAGILGVRFTGGHIGGDRFSNKWDGIVIGSNAKQRSFKGPQVIFESYLQSSDTNNKKQLLNNCNAPSVECSVVSYRKGATIEVDLSRSVYPKNAKGVADKTK